MLKRWSERISQKMGSKKDSTRKRDAATVRIDLDELGPGAEQELAAMASEMSGIPFYEGHVEHGYSMDDVSTAQECPRCHASTQQYYANWIYATQIAPRVMFAPAGYFCTECPTVIIDEGMIQVGVKKGFRFRCVLGLDYEGREKPDFFRTWNGKTAVYIFDEHETAMGLSTLDSTGSQPSRRTGPTPRRRKRTAKQFGKRKRRRKKR